MQWQQAKELEPKLFALMDYLIPLYREEGKSQLVIAIGCTGGKHRSVVFTQRLQAHLAAKGLHAGVSHRDIEK